MPHTIPMQDYIAFMQWFQITYPDLYACCWQNIAVPVDGEGVTVVQDGMNHETYKAVIDATKQYYQKENS